MSRNGTGTYNAPVGNPVAAGTVITSIWANSTIADIGAEITNSLPRDGQAPMTGVLKLQNGSVGIPSITFNSDATTGLYRVGAGDIAITAGGTKVASFNATTGLDVASTLKIPVGTTAQREASPVDGLLRYNSTLLQFEGYYNSAWQSVGSGQLLGTALTKAIFYNSTTIGENLTIAANTNGMSAGPITVNNTFTVTVSDGTVWTVL